jgi:hypothetical protein
MVLGISGLVSAQPAQALTTTTPCVPYATYQNGAPDNSSAGAGQSNLSFPKFNVANASLTQVKVLFSGNPSCTGAAPIKNSPGLTYGYNPGLPVSNGSTVSIANVQAQVQLFFGSTPLGTNPVGGPLIPVSTSSSSFVANSATRFSTASATGAYSGSSSPITSPNVLAAFSGAGNINTTSFQTVWNSDLTCTRVNGTSCKGSVGSTYSLELGSQQDLDNVPSALFEDAWVSLEYTYSVKDTPGPLPILGAGLAFGWAKRLRRRVASTV